MSEILGGLGVHWMSALALIVGFPTALVILNELAFSLARANHPLVHVTRTLRTWVVPSIGLALFLRLVLERPSSDLWVRLAETLVVGQCRDLRARRRQRRGVRARTAGQLAAAGTEPAA